MEKADIKYCRNCGNKLPKAVNICDKCGENTDYAGLAATEATNAVVCPYCGSQSVAHILYGYPSYDEEMQRQLENKEIVLGGCIIQPNNPAFHCNECDRDFGVADDDDDEDSSDGDGDELERYIRPKVLFCKIANMKYYRGVTDDDKPRDGGSWVVEKEDGAEAYNFYPTECDDGEIDCFGFFATKENKYGPYEYKATRIERIVGSSARPQDESEPDVLVVWCTKTSQNVISVVGWYNHAIVFRHYKNQHFEDAELCDENDNTLFFNVVAKASNCVLLPTDVRQEKKWHVPNAKQDGYGFGQSMTWYADKPEAQNFVAKIVDTISHYNGDNWVNIPLE